MKVLFVIDSLGAGGAERSLDEMLGPLVSMGANVTVACLKTTDVGFQRGVVARGHDVRLVRGRFTATRVLDLRHLITDLRPDVVHTTLFEADVVGRLAAVGTRASLLTSLVNTTYDPVRLGDPRVSAPKLRASRMIDGLTARHLTDHFHAITHAVKDAAVEALGIRSELVTVIERGRDPARLGEPSPDRRERSRRSLGLEPDDEVLVNLGRQEYQKGLDVLIRAVELLAARRPHLVVVQAGRRGHASDHLHALRDQASLHDRVHFMGHRDDVPEILAAADVFVFPSRYEGLGGSLVEAMALGLPVVASDIPALREVLEPGGNAVLVPPGKPAELAEAIVSLLDDGARRAAFGQRSRQLFEARFALERSVDRMMALYRRLAG